MNSKRPGITLVEVIVVLTIVALLVGLLVPGVMRSRASADRQQCLNQLRSHALAVFGYEQARGKLPPGLIRGPYDAHAVPEGVVHGLWSCLLGFLEQPHLAAEYRFDKSFDDVENQPVVRARMKSLICPGVNPANDVVFEADTAGAAIRWGGPCTYGPIQPSAILADLGWSDPEIDFTGALPGNANTHMGAVKDGLSTTILLAEFGERAPAWASPTVLSGVRQVFPGGRPGGAVHIDGLNVVFCDGSGRTIRWDINPRVFAALCTRNGGETVAANEY